MSLSMQRDINELTRQLAQTNEKLAHLEERLDALEVKRAPGRPPKDEVRAETHR